jgi:hypothetical protein
MKVVANENIIYGFTLNNTITKNCIYAVISEVDGYYELKNDAGIIKQYNKQYFTPIKEEVMKIRQWEDLDNKILTLNGYKLSTVNNDKTIQIFKGDDYCGEFKPLAFSNEQIIAHLALLGIKVEFEKPMTITQEEYDLLKYLSHKSTGIVIQRNMSSQKLYCKWGQLYGCTLEISNADDFKWFELGKEYLVSDLLKMKVEG